MSDVVVCSYCGDVHPISMRLGPNTYAVCPSIPDGKMWGFNNGVTSIPVDLTKEIAVLKEKLALAREFIYEVSLPRFKDSDADSLLETLRRNAVKFMEATNNLT